MIAVKTLNCAAILCRLHEKNWDCVWLPRLLVFPQDLGISKVGHMKRILQGTKDLAKASMVDLWPETRQQLEGATTDQLWELCRLRRKHKRTAESKILPPGEGFWRSQYALAVRFYCAKVTTRAWKEVADLSNKPFLSYSFRTRNQVCN